MDNRKIPFSALTDSLSEELMRRGSEEAYREGFSRIELRTDQADPILWLKAQPWKEKIFFESRGRGEPVVAAVGNILELNGIDRAGEEELLTLPEELIRSGMKMFGGISFFKENPNSEEWRSFGASRFVLPRFEYIIKDKKGYFIINYRNYEAGTGNIKKLLSEINSLKPIPKPEEGNSGKVCFRRYSPDIEGWGKMISTYLDRIKRGDVEKMVGARRLELDHDGKVDPFKILSELKMSGDYTANFLFTFNGDDFFLGATPERLFMREGDLLSAESIAGTSPRGKDKEQDDIIGKDLLRSKKNTLEHDIVTEDIVKKIDPLCEMAAISERVLLKLSGLQHLYRKISGKVKKKKTDWTLIDVLAPTPAVSGKPLKKSFDILKKEEPFDRGWYSGIVGFAGKDISDYYVAIRSMLLRKDKIFIYSGAGIVPGSDPEKEWEEIDLKIKKYKKILKYEN